MTKKQAKNLRPYALKAQQLVEKCWYNEAATKINLKWNEIFTLEEPEKLKNFAQKRKIKQISSVMEPSVPFHNLVELVDAEDIRIEKLVLLIYHCKLIMFYQDWNFINLFPTAFQDNEKTKKENETPTLDWNRLWCHLGITSKHIETKLIELNILLVVSKDQKDTDSEKVKKLVSNVFTATEYVTSRNTEVSPEIDLSTPHRCCSYLENFMTQPALQNSKVRFDVEVQFSMWSMMHCMSTVQILTIFHLIMQRIHLKLLLYQR